MSSDLYYRCLSWRSGQTGIAKEGDLKLLIHSPPPVFPTAVEIEFGEVHRGECAYAPFVRETAGGPKRDMTAPEIIALRAWLVSIWTGAMRYATRPIIKEERRRR